MRWDGQAYASVVKSGLYELFANQIPQASIMGNKEYADYLKNNCEHSTILGHNPNVKGMITIKAVNLFANDNGIEIDFINHILNCNNDTSITLSWSLAARHIRAWEYEKAHGDTNAAPSATGSDRVKDQWDNTHLCGNRFDNNVCEFFLKTDSNGTTMNGKRLDRCCYYCTSENKVRKIGSGGSWTGLSPKFCPKRKALEQNNGEPTEADITLFKQYEGEFSRACRFDKVMGSDNKYAKQHWDKANEIYNEIVNKGLEQAYKKWREMNHKKTEQQSMCDDCANNDGSCLKPTEGECVRYVSIVHLDNLLFLAKHAGYKDSVTDFLDKFLQKYPNFDVNRFEELKPFLQTEEKPMLENKAAEPEKYIEPYLTAKEEEDKMTPNFNFKGFISEGNQLKQVPLDMLVPYHNHKFKLYEGERLEDMVNSIKENGVLTPIIVRNMGGEHYEILAGHNRTNAARLAGLNVIPAIVKENLSDDEAEMYVIETNVMQRGFDDLSISERAAVIAARHSAMFDEDKRKAIERELAALNGNAPANEEESDEGEKKSKLAAVGESYGLSKDSVARLIRIDKLSDELKSYVDSGDIPLRAGVNLSYLLPNEQKMLVRVMIDCVNTKISMKQSELLRELSREKNLTENNVREIVLTGKLTDHSDPTPRKPIKVKISADIGAKYFAPNWDEDKVRQIVELALEQYFTNTDRLIMDENDEYQI